MTTVDDMARQMMLRTGGVDLVSLDKHQQKGSKRIRGHTWNMQLKVDTAAGTRHRPPSLLVDRAITTCTILYNTIVAIEPTHPSLVWLEYPSSTPTNLVHQPSSQLGNQNTSYTTSPLLAARRARNPGRGQTAIFAGISMNWWVFQ